MDTSAGISLRRSASMLCVLNGGSPRVLARTMGYQKFTPPPIPPPRAPRPGGLRGLLASFGSAQKPAGTGKPYFPFDQSGALLHALRAAGPSGAPGRVAIAVPAWANDVQRQAVADGARKAGWTVLALVNEPTAAAMASGVLGSGAGITVVYDLEDDHFDVTVLSCDDAGFEVLAADGLPDVSAGQPLLSRLVETEAPCIRALYHAGVDKTEIGSVVVVGETVRGAEAIQYLTEMFETPPRIRFDPVEVVGIGAAVHASLLESR